MPLTRLLLIEDSPSDARWLQDMLELEPAAEDIRVAWTQHLQSGLKRLSEANFAAVLLDLNLPDSQGLDSLSQVQALYPTIPVVVLASESVSDIASQAMLAGAQDYLIKGQVGGDDIVRAVRHAIERKRAELDLERRAREMQALYETSLEINAQIDLDSLLQALVERAARLMGVPMGGLYLLQPDKESIRLDYVYNIEKDYRGVVLKLGEGLSGKVVQTGQPQSVEDYQHWEDRSPAFDGANFRRVLAVPLRIAGKVTGVINLSDDQSTGQWSDDEIRLASLFADQAAIAVQNARLLEAERQRSTELARSNAMIHALGQVAWRLAETLDPNQILDILSSELKKLEVSAAMALFEGEPAELVVNYLSIDPKTLELTEKMLGQRLRGFHLPSGIWPLEDGFSERKSYFIEDSLPMLANVFMKIPASKLELAMGHIGVTHRTPTIYLPLVIKEQPLGMMAVWGSQLRRDDLPAFTVFANQAAVALENARLYNRIERQTILDELTGLYNRRGFFMLAEQQLRVAQRAGNEILLVFIDVDQLKLINDTCGHKEGDRALVKTAEALRATFRAADIPARISGDEFAVLAYSSNELGAASLMERLKHEIERVNTRGRLPFSLSISAGYAVWSPGQPASLDELLARADAQMYQVKRKRITGELKPPNA